MANAAIDAVWMGCVDRPCSAISLVRNHSRNDQTQKLHLTYVLNLYKLHLVF
jgi:hypothetical protein